MGTSKGNVMSCHVKDKKINIQFFLVLFVCCGDMKCHDHEFLFIFNFYIKFICNSVKKNGCVCVCLCADKEEMKNRKNVILYSY